MWKKLSARLYSLSTGRTTLIALVVFLLFMGLVLPAQASKAESYAKGMGSPDTSFYYSTDELYQTAQVYGADGRREYIRARFNFDIILPLTYTFFLCTSISWLFSKATISSKALKKANLVPVLGTFLDFAKNLSISIVMMRYPKPTFLLDVLAAIFTMTKWILVSGSFLLVLVGAALGLAQEIKRRKESKQGLHR
ncbi:MAG: hypothetical protein Kow002_14390 [Anaerolineales bacterium]